MKLSDLIIEHRNTHGLSQRQFAQHCGLSNGYISMLEKGMNPATQKPVTPTIPQLKKLAKGMGITISELLSRADDMPIDLGLTDEDQGHKIIPLENNGKNVLRIAGRDGSYRERTLTDAQLEALTAILDQMPDASNDI